MSSTPSERGDPLVAQLFGEYLVAEEQGLDASSALVARAGEKGEALARKIRIHCDLRALSTQIQAEASAATPTTIGRFDVLSCLGEGGLGVVYLARDPLLHRTVALKVLDKRASPGKRAWVLNEARSLARLEHPGVVKVHEVGETDQFDTIVMEHLAGPSLEQVIAELRARRTGRSRAETDSEVRRIADQLTTFSARVACLARIADALAYCHDNGILHRDVKPANILFDKDGRPHLIDFGLAHLEDADEAAKVRLTQELVGTPAYIAPEQVELGRIGADPRSDQFSFSVVAYELLALENPFDQGSRTRTLDAITLAQPPALRSVDPAIPADLAYVVHHGLERSPEDRFPAMTALAADLGAVLEHRPPSVKEPSLQHIARLWLRRHRKTALTVSVASGALLALAALAWTLGALHDRSRVLSSLAAIDVEACHTPNELGASVTALFDLERAAADFESGWLRGLLWGGLHERVQEVVEHWSRRLGDVYRAERARSEEDGTPFQENAYRRLFVLDARLCPECRFNDAERNRGRVFYPSDEAGNELAGYQWELDILMPLAIERDSFATFRPTEMVDEPIPGVYRLRGWEPGADRLAYEQDFYVPEGGPLARRLEIRSPRSEFLDQTVPVERAVYTALDGRSRFPVPSFHVLGRTVSITEFDRFCRETSWTPAKRANPSFADEEAPVLVDIESALGFAAWAGGRLPSAAELWMAASSGAIELPAHSSLACGEHVIDLIPDSTHHSSAIFRYGTHAIFGEPPADALIQVLGLNPGRGCPGFPPLGLITGPIAGPAFRLVFPAGTPEEYRGLARQPRNN